MVKVVSAWVVGFLLAVLYLYAATAAIGNLIGMSGLAGALGTGLSAVGWIWLITGIVMPVVLLSLALILGRKRKAGIRILLLAVGITVVAVLQIDLMHLIPESSYFA
ncbi:DUF3422 domain-containing protein [Leucobacter viscericola]|uniref:DUF3422 domain-containing protein n=1 Tax=Leucobacter viscericola TaxID=2714935 RepID=A0A6G7XDC9_9MICO|nr:DUF3422 domain-containing protein [Leucobacter viscericola]QIK62449.1 DUF3422 domain-containing protein [Leucobacter viscericola]